MKNKRELIFGLAVIFILNILIIAVVQAAY